MIVGSYTFGVAAFAFVWKCHNIAMKGRKELWEEFRTLRKNELSHMQAEINELKRGV